MRYLIHRFRGRAIVLTCALLVASVASTMYVQPVLAADPPANQLSKKAFPPIKAANDAIVAKQFDVALQKLQEAEGVDKKTPYDQFKIEELRALVYLQQGNYAQVRDIYEKHLSTPEYLEPQQSAIRMKALTQLSFQAQAYPKVLEYGKEWLAQHPDDTAIMDLMARASYISKDYKSAIEMANTAIKTTEDAGKTPDELMLQLVPSSASSLNDQATLLSGYQRLVRYYPKQEHWSKVLEALLGTEKNDVATLYVLRLMADTDVIKQPEYYFEYAQRAVENGLPSEAAKVLETGLEKKVIGVGSDKDRYQRTLADVKKKAQTDKAQLPEIEKEWKDGKGGTGQTGAGLGLAYFGLQMYEQAAQTLEAAIAKGGLRNADDYRMALGISYLRSGQKDKAREQFQKIPANSPLARIAGFWTARTYNAA